MSWDVRLYKSSSGKPPKRDTSGEIQGESFGSFSELKELLSESCPGIRWGDSGYADYGGYGWTGTFWLSADDDDIRRITLTTYPELGMHFVCELCKEFGWFAYDPQEGKFIDLDGLEFIPCYEDDFPEDDEDLPFKVRRPENIEGFMIEDIKYLED